MRLPVAGLAAVALSSITRHGFKSEDEMYWFLLGVTEAHSDLTTNYDHTEHGETYEVGRQIGRAILDSVDA